MLKSVVSILCLGGLPAHAQQVTNYTYDALGRLVQVVQGGGPGSGTSVAYTYDAAGNRQTYVSTNPSGFSIANATANEGAAHIFAVSRSNTTSAMTVNYATSDGTAIAGNNYIAGWGTISFASGVASQLISVSTINTGIAGPNLGMSVTLSAPSIGGSISNPVATGTIVNTNIAPSFSIANALTNEGSPLTFVVTRAGSTTNAVTVNYATSNGTALAGTNYTSASGSLSFAAGVATQTFIVATTDDDIYTSNLTLTAALSSPSSGATLGTGTATGTVVNVDAQPSLSIAAALANEGSPLAFSVTRTGATGNVVTAAYATSNGSAVAGANYTATSGTISFAAGVTSRTISVPTINDGVVSPNLTMTTTLASPTGNAVLGTSNATGTVVNTNTGWSSTLTAGTWQFCYGTCITDKGYISALSTGSMSVVTINGYTIASLASGSGVIYLYETGNTAPPNSGWTSITIPGVGTLQRSAATYSVSGSSSEWSWTSSATVASGTVTIQ